MFSPVPPAAHPALRTGGSAADEHTIATLGGSLEAGTITRANTETMARTGGGAKRNNAIVVGAFLAAVLVHRPVRGRTER